MRGLGGGVGLGEFSPLLNPNPHSVTRALGLNHGRSQILDAPAQAIPANVPSSKTRALGIGGGGQKIQVLRAVLNSYFILSILNVHKGGGGGVGV